MKKLVGKVKPEERDRIKYLFGRKNALTDLAKSLTADDNKELYEKMLKDSAETNMQYQAWWDEMYAKYKWERCKNTHWSIDFDSGDIFLVFADSSCSCSK